jgi:SAM-dependent methyltransferase
MNTRWMSVGPGISEAPVIAGPLVAIRRDAYEQVGGYDVGFGAGGFHHHALSMQAWRAGYRCLVVPASEVAYPFPVAPAEGPAWLVHLRDLVRLVSLHLDPPELVVALSAICSNEAFPMAAGQLLDEDLAARRAQLAERSVETVAAVLGRLCGPIFAAGDRTPLGPAPEAAGGQGPAPYAEANRKVWAHWASSGAHSSRPVVRSDLEGARDTLDPEGWLSWSELSTVLCLGAGGGQQAPLFASLGYEVTLLDLSPEQLALDRQVADALELSLEIVEGDMLDLTVLGGRVFDLVFQPVSACYIPDVHLLYEQVRLVTRPGGQYLVEHWNPTQIQLEGHGQWDGTGYRLVHPQGGGRPVLWEVPGRGPEVEPLTTWHYIHPLTDLIGGMLRAGFSIRRFAERWEGDPTADPGTERHLASFAPPFLRILAESPAGPDSPAGSRHS